MTTAAPGLPSDLFDAFGRPIFDKKRLTTDPEFTQYLYEIAFKEKPTLDMRAGGYMHAIRPYLLTYSIDVINLTTTNVGGYVQVKLKIKLLSGLEFEEVSDAFESLRETPLRLAVTSVFKRAIARILDISGADFGNVNVATFDLSKFAYGNASGGGRQKARPVGRRDIVDSPAAKRIAARSALKKDESDPTSRSVANVDEDSDDTGDTWGL